MKNSLKDKHQIKDVKSVEKSHKESAESTRNLKIRSKLKIK